MYFQDGEPVKDKSGRCGSIANQIRGTREYWLVKFGEELRDHTIYHSSHLISRIK